MALFRRRRQVEPPPDPDEVSPLTGLKYKDLIVVDQLVKAGADLAQPRHVRYFLYFASEEIADAAARDARRGAFDVSVGDPSPDSSNGWSIVSERSEIVLDVETIRNNTEYFETLARRHGGDFDGWEASVN